MSKSEYGQPTAAVVFKFQTPLLIPNFYNPFFHKHTHTQHAQRHKHVMAPTTYTRKVEVGKTGRSFIAGEGGSESVV